MTESRQEKVKEIVQQLEQGVEAVFTSNNYIKLLDMMSRFHNYSYNNCILILTQCPTASYCGSYALWKRLGHPVKKGEKGIKILVPVPYIYQKIKNVADDDGNIVQETTEEKGLTFRIGCVFDASQVEGELPSIVQELKDDSQELQNAVQQIISENDNIGYDPTLRKGCANGYYHLDDRKIYLRQDMAALQTFKTIIHEKAHSLLHNSDSGRYTRQEAEVQAESVAYIVCKAFGLNSSDYSFGYIASWSSGRDVKELKNSLAVIEKTAKEIMNWCTIHSNLKLMIPE